MAGLIGAVAAASVATYAAVLTAELFLIEQGAELETWPFGTIAIAAPNLRAGRDLLIPMARASLEARDRCIELFGSSSVIVRTGRADGGWHMIFAAPRGVALESVNLRRFGIDADLKAGRSFVVGPGSVHPKTGNVYRFERGGWDDLATLPCFPDERLRDLAGADDEQIAETVRAPSPTRNLEGTRNRALFKHLCTHCKEFSTHDDVVAEARAYNRDCNETPEEDSKVLATAESVWRRIQEGTIRAPGRKNRTIPPLAFVALRPLGRDYEAGLALFVELTSAHPEGGTFAISATAMAKAESVPGRRDREVVHSRNASPSAGWLA